MTLRRSTDPDAVLDAFETVAAQASTPILLQVLAQTRAPAPALASLHAQGRTGQGLRHPRSPRAARARSAGARGPICQTRSSSASRHCRRWAAACRPALRDHRAAGAARRIESCTLVRGSRLPLPDTRFIRLFLWWKNGRAHGHRPVRRFLRRQFRVHADGRVLQPEGLRRLPQRRHRRRPQGASEFIDLDIDALVEKGIRYVVTSINSYTRQPYCDLPECFAGWMARADLASGEVYEPRTVVDRIDIASDTQICLPS